MIAPISATGMSIWWSESRCDRQAAEPCADDGCPQSRRALRKMMDVRKADERPAARMWAAFGDMGKL